MSPRSDQSLYLGLLYRSEVWFGREMHLKYNQNLVIDFPLSISLITVMENK